MAGTRATTSPPPSVAMHPAAVAGLRYVTDASPGITREKHGTGFRYRRSGGRLVRDDCTLRRIRSLAIPPAWVDVWICPTSTGHIQATGRDAAGRKQYRYHPRWRLVRDETKFARLARFGSLLPRIRARVRRDLKLPGLPQAKVLATIVRLMEATHLRVGNDEYARQNGSHGLTTLYDRHVRVGRRDIRFCFRGKSGKWRRTSLDDPQLARIVRRCRDLPGQRLFQCLDERGRRRSVTSADVNRYLREATGEDFTAKDFRTWVGTLWATRALQDARQPRSMRQEKTIVVGIVRLVAERLGNTEAVCRKCYIHPRVLEAAGDASLRRRLVPKSARRTPAGRTLEASLVRYLKLNHRRRAA